MSLEAPPRRVVAIDLGGTRIKSGLCDAAGTVHRLLTHPTPAGAPVGEVLGLLADSALELAGGRRELRRQVEGVVVAACGLVDSARGVFLGSSVLPHWREVPVAAELSRRLGVPVRLDNDATAAIYGEWWRGVGRGSRHLVGMTLGTGIGGGVVIDGTPYRGASGNAGEFGHISVVPDGERCFCGNRGCLGQLASATALVRLCERQLGAGRPSALGGGGPLTALAVHRAAEAGDELAREAIDEVGRRLGAGVAILLSAFNPEVVVFTGGLTGLGTRLLSAIRREAAAHTYPHLSQVARIELGELGERAGVIGAAGLWSAAA